MPFCMKASNSIFFSIPVPNPVNRTQKYLVYQHKQYPVNFNLLEINSNQNVVFRKTKINAKMNNL